MHCAGKHIELPSGFRLVHVQRKEQDGHCSWSAQKVSRHIRIWEQDVAPCSTTARVRALEWASLAPVLHTPVPFKDTLSRLQNLAVDGNQAAKEEAAVKEEATVKAEKTC
jgi:hypothetical protein